MKQGCVGDLVADKSLLFIAVPNFHSHGNWKWLERVYLLGPPPCGERGARVFSCLVSTCHESLGQDSARVTCHSTSGLGMFQALLTAFQQLTFPADSTSWRNRYIEFWAQWGQLQASDKSVSQWKIAQKSAPKKMQAPGTDIQDYQHRNQRRARA